MPSRAFPSAHVIVRDLCNAFGPSGYEDDVRAYISGLITPLVDDLRVDSTGNLIAMRKGRSARKLMLDAHTDEVGIMVRYIDEKGFLRFAKIGGWELELIQPLEGENDYTHFLDTKGEGIHHILFDVQDMDATLAALGEKGIEVLQTGTGLRPGTRFVYLDTRDLIGFPLEMRNTVAGSDGSSPVPPAKATG